jgi:hypothetical protein
MEYDSAAVPTPTKFLYLRQEPDRLDGLFKSFKKALAVGWNEYRQIGASVERAGEAALDRSAMLGLAEKQSPLQTINAVTGM